MYAFIEQKENELALPPPVRDGPNVISAQTENLTSENLLNLVSDDRADTHDSGVTAASAEPTRTIGQGETATSTAAALSTNETAAENEPSQVTGTGESSKHGLDSETVRNDGHPQAQSGESLLAKIAYSPARLIRAAIGIQKAGTSNINVNLECEEGGWQRTRETKRGEGRKTVIKRKGLGEGA